MLYGGEYQAPAIRQKLVHAVVVAEGTRNVIARMRAQNMSNYSGTYALNRVTALITNVGGDAVTVRLQQAPALTSSRTFVTDPIAIARGGHVSVNFIPTSEFLEVIAVSGESELRMQMASVLRYDTMALAKSDPLTPLKTWNAILPPVVT